MTNRDLSVTLCPPPHPQTSPNIALEVHPVRAGEWSGMACVLFQKPGLEQLTFKCNATNAFASILHKVGGANGGAGALFVVVVVVIVVFIIVVVVVVFIIIVVFIFIVVFVAIVVFVVIVVFIVIFVIIVTLTCVLYLDK